MKNVFAVACFSAVLFFASKHLAAEDAPTIKGENVTVTGEVIDVWCYSEGGDHGAEHKKCATACIKAGNPVGILDEKGVVYIAMGGQRITSPGVTC